MAGEEQVVFSPVFSEEESSLKTPKASPEKNADIGRSAKLPGTRESPSAGRLPLSPPKRSPTPPAQSPTGSTNLEMLPELMEAVEDSLKQFVENEENKAAEEEFRHRLNILSPTGDFIDENDPALHEGGILDVDVDEDDGSDAALEDQNSGYVSPLLKELVL